MSCLNIAYRQHVLRMAKAECLGHSTDAWANRICPGRQWFETDQRHTFDLCNNLVGQL